MQSAFLPVVDYKNYVIYSGFKKIEPKLLNFQVKKTSFVSCSEEDKPKRTYNKRKWSIEQKVKAISVVKKYGIQKGLIYLQQSDPLQFFSLSTSTLQYWYKQSLKKNY